VKPKESKMGFSLFSLTTIKTIYYDWVVMITHHP